MSSPVQPLLILSSAKDRCTQRHLYFLIERKLVETLHFDRCPTVRARMNKRIIRQKSTEFFSYISFNVCAFVPKGRIFLSLYLPSNSHRKVSSLSVQSLLWQRLPDVEGVKAQEESQSTVFVSLSSEKVPSMVIAVSIPICVGSSRLAIIFCGRLSRMENIESIGQIQRYFVSGQPSPLGGIPLTHLNVCQLQSS